MLAILPPAAGDCAALSNAVIILCPGASSRWGSPSLLAQDAANKTPARSGACLNIEQVFGFEYHYCRGFFWLAARLVIPREFYINLFLIYFFE